MRTEFGSQGSHSTRYREKLVVLALACIAALLQPAPESRAQEEDDPRYSPRAVAMLPPYCRNAQIYRNYVQGGDDAERIKHWFAVLGGTFNDIHHYCWALTHINNANYASNLSQAQRLGLLGHAIGEIGYVVRHSPPSFVLLPELLTKRAELRIRRGELMQAAPDLSRAIQLKPDYWPAYVALSDLAKQGGDVALARQWIEKGLAQAPDSKTLQQKQAELGGSRGAAKASPSAPAKPPAARQPDGSAQQAPAGKPETDTAPAGQ